MVKRVIDSEESEQKGLKISNMMDKSRCFDIFYKTTLDGIPMYEQDSYERKLKYKFNRNNIFSEYNTLKLLQSIHAFKGHFYVKSLLKRIELSK
jgi:hypothetical protein